MSSTRKDFLHKYYGEAESSTPSDFEAPKPPRKKKKATSDAAPLPTQGLKIIDFTDDLDQKVEDIARVGNKGSYFLQK